MRSKAPLRLGLGGGGSDLSPYCDTFGGAVLNATIDMYAYAFLDSDSPPNRAIFHAQDLQVYDEIDLTGPLTLDGNLKLHRAVYLRVMNNYNGGRLLPIRLTTRSDVPPGSGLGSSSTMVVAMLEAYRQLLKLPMGEYDVARIAYEIERIDCDLSGGRQDQYAATFGGFNFIEFYSDERVIVNPLRIRRYIASELESSLLLFYTGASRDSSKIINDQIKSVKNESSSMEAMHRVKASAIKMKEYLFKANFSGIASEFNAAWKSKIETSPSITNNKLKHLESVLMAAGAQGVKVSGAGGGGFMMIFTEPEKRLELVRVLESFEGRVHNFRFTNEGAYSWMI